MTTLPSTDDSPLRSLSEFRGTSLWQQLAQQKPQVPRYPIGWPPGTWVAPWDQPLPEHASRR